INSTMTSIVRSVVSANALAETRATRRLLTSGRCAASRNAEDDPLVKPTGMNHSAIFANRRTAPGAATHNGPRLAHRARRARFSGSQVVICATVAEWAFRQPTFREFG